MRRPLPAATAVQPEEPPDLIVTDIEEKIYEIVCEHMGASRDKLAPETSFINDLGADSLDTVELVMEFESAFDITIPDEDAEKIQTVGNAISYITGKVAG